MSTYIWKYLNFARHKREFLAVAKLDLRECELLSFVTEAHLTAGEITVNDVLGLSYIASPATLHAITKKLISKGMIKVTLSSADGRIKFLSPTPKVLKLYEELGKKL